MSLINHPVWFPSRESLGSFPTPRVIPRHPWLVHVFLKWLLVKFMSPGLNLTHTQTAVGQNQWYHFVAFCTTHIRTYFSGWIGMFTGGSIWVLTHTQIAGSSRIRVGRPGFSDLRPTNRWEYSAELGAANQPPKPEGPDRSSRFPGRSSTFFPPPLFFVCFFGVCFVFAEPGKMYSFVLPSELSTYF